MDLNPENPSIHNSNQVFTSPDTMDCDDVRVFSVLNTALKQKDYNTQLHATRVAGYTKRLAQRLGYGLEKIQAFELGGMLHDLGKLALSDELLNHRESKLTPEMRDEVFSHPLIGAALVEHTLGKGIIHDAVLYHHERLDGSGYPFGLRGDQIPISAQMVSVADCFDAITTNRPYQKGKSRIQAFKILCGMAGKALDRDLVALLIEDVSELGLVVQSGEYAGEYMYVKSAWL